jgi:hypothetical protein
MSNNTPQGSPESFGRSKNLNRPAVILGIVMATSLVAHGQEDGKARLYVSDSESWQMSGGFGVHNGDGGGHFSGGARPQTVELIKTFTQRCPAVIVTMDGTKAEYVVLFDREGGKGYLRKRDKIAVFKKDGDLLYSGSTHSVGGAVEDACGFMQKGGARD